MNTTIYKLSLLFIAVVAIASFGASINTANAGLLDWFSGPSATVSATSIPTDPIGNYICTGNTANLDNGRGTGSLDFCGGSSYGLTQNTQYDIYPSCSANKCAFTCKPGYTYSTVMGTNVSICVPNGGGETALTCTPSEQSIGLNLGAKFEAFGGNGTYSWSITDSAHCFGETETGPGGGARYWPQCSAPGYKTVKVTSGSKTATCGLTVTAPASYSCQMTSNLGVTGSWNACSDNATGPNQSWTVKSSCTGICAVTCNAGYHQDGGQCIVDAPTTHHACVNNSCSIVSGAGTDSCSSNAQCAAHSCNDPGALSGSITSTGGGSSHASASATNNSSCSKTVTFSTYKVFIEPGNPGWLDTQVLFDSQTEILAAYETKTFSVNTASCRTQLDLYEGPVQAHLSDAAGGFPGQNLLDYAFTGSALCGYNPQLSCSPANQNVNVGQNASLSASGGNGTYTWSASSGNPSSGSGTNFSTNYNNAGNKTVSVTSGGQTATCSVHVNTPPPNPLYCNPGTQTVSVGNTANFNATGGSGIYSWSANGGAPATGTGTNFSTAYSSAGSKSVTVNDGTQTAQCLVVVNPPTASLTCSPSTQSVNVGDIAVFNASGGNGNLTWSAPNGAPSTGSGTNFSTAYSSSGNKTVTVSDGNQSAQCAVTVNQAQSLTCSPSTQNANTNSIVTFTSTGGNGNYSWSASGGNPSTGTSNHFSTSYSTEGVKTITVTDGSQSAQCSANITVPACVAPNSYLTATTNINQYAATLNAFIDPQGSPVNYYFEYGTSNSLGYSSGQQTVTTPQAVTASISNLQPNTTYYFRLRTSNSCGINDPGVIFSFTTNGNTPPPPVNNPIYCSTSNQNVNVGDWVNFSANGGNSTWGMSNYNYYWSAPWDASPSSGNGQSFGTKFSQSGSKVITVISSNGQSAQCIVNVNQQNNSQNQNLQITKNVLNRTLGQSAYVQYVDAQQQDLVEFEIRVNANNYQGYNNNSNNNVSVNVRDVLPYGLTYVIGSTRVNGSQYQDGITSGGIYLNNFYSGQEQVIRFLATVNQGLSSGTLTNQATATMNNLSQNASASVNVRPRGTVLGAADIVTGPGDNLPWILSLAFLSAGLMYFFFFNGKTAKTPSFNIAFAEEAPAKIVAVSKKKTELEKLLDAIKAEESKPDL